MQIPLQIVIYYATSLLQVATTVKEASTKGLLTKSKSVHLSLNVAYTNQTIIIHIKNCFGVS